MSDFEPDPISPGPTLAGRLGPRTRTRLQIALLILALLMAGIAATAYVAGPDAGAQQRAQTRFTLSARLVTALHNAASLRDRFVRSSDPEGISRYAALIGETDSMREQLRRLRPLRESMAALDALDNALAAHDTALESAAARIDRIGRNERVGLLGEAGQSVSALTQSLTSLARPGMLTALNALQVAERDVLLQRGRDPLARFNDLALDLNFKLLRASVPEAQQTAINQRLEEYGNAVASIATAMARRDSHVATMRERMNEAQAAALRIAENAQARMLAEASGAVDAAVDPESLYLAGIICAVLLVAGLAILAWNGAALRAALEEDVYEDTGRFRDPGQVPRGVARGVTRDDQTRSQSGIGRERRPPPTPATTPRSAPLPHAPSSRVTPPNEEPEVARSPVQREREIPLTGIIIHQDEILAEFETEPESAS